MEVTLKPGEWVDPDKMLRTIRSAGFTPVPEEVHFTVTGRVKAEGDRLVLELDGMKAPKSLPLVAHSTAPDLLATLRGRTGETVELQGRWQRDGSLAVTRLGGAEAASPSPRTP